MRVFVGLFKLVGGIVGAIIGLMFAVSLLSNEKSVTPTPLTPLERLETAQLSALTPDGELAQIFTYGSNFTDLQRQLKLKEIRGKVVDWRLPVYEVKQSGNDYIIQTSTGKLFEEKLIGTILTVTPRNEDDRRLIERLKTGDLVRFKGIIDDITLRHLDIKPAILVLDEVVFFKQLMGKVYGKYNPTNNCWDTLNSNRDSQTYCMKLYRTDKINSGAGVRYYVLALGDAVDEKGEPNGIRPTQGMVGAFVVEARNGQPELVASNPKIVMGSFGNPPTDWKFVKLGTSDYWGWQSETGTCGSGSCESLHVILAPYGKQIHDLADGLPASFGTGNEATYETRQVKLHIDSSQSNEKVFPLLLTVTGESKGQEITPKNVKVPFDEKQWKYVLNKTVRHFYE